MSKHRTGADLRRDLQALGITGRAFARLLSEYAEPGHDVDAKTVSRWLTGATGVPPAVGLAVDLLLRVKELGDAFVPPPVERRRERARAKEE